MCQSAGSGSNVLAVITVRLKFRETVLAYGYIPGES
jgi:hypothetical protein